MMRWLEASGADVASVRVASARPGSPRGVLAARDLVAGEVALSIPGKLALAMGALVSPTAAEAAVQLLREKVSSWERGKEAAKQGCFSTADTK
jgi:hypothetical protein